jgi:N-succinyldiaminopimelate aminotransferase
MNARGHRGAKNGASRPWRHEDHTPSPIIPGMNPLLSRLQPYPFERLRQLFAGVTPNPAYRAISLGIGEPKHPTPRFIKDALAAPWTSPATTWPATRPPPARRNCAGLRRLAAAPLRPGDRPGHAGAAGQRFARSAVRLRPDRDRPALARPVVVCPNPFYQIYEGAALLAGRRAVLRAQRPVAQLRGRLGQRAGSHLGPHPAGLRLLARQPHRRGDAAGRMEEAVRAAGPLRLHDRPTSATARSTSATSRRWAAWKRRRSSDARLPKLVAFTSLSKRSNVPGLRSGFVAGDAELIKQFLLYRTYHGSAMSPIVQAPAWRPGTTRRTWSTTASSTAASSPKSAAAGPRAGRETARRQLLPLGRGCVEATPSLRPRPAGSIQCDRAAGQLPGPRSRAA